MTSLITKQSFLPSVSHKCVPPPTFRGIRTHTQHSVQLPSARQHRRMRVQMMASSAQHEQQEQENDEVEWDENHEPGESVPLVPGKVVDLMAVDFDSVMEKAGNKLFMVDVFTQWCGPCKMIAPEIEIMAEELGDSVVLSKMDCTSDNDNKKWAMTQKVRALPTFIFFKNGERITEMTGAKTSSLRKLIEAHK